MSGSNQSVDQFASLTRRSFLQSGGMSLAGLSLLDHLVLQELLAAPAAADQKVETLNRFPRMVQEYFVERVREQEAKTIARLDALKTKFTRSKIMDRVTQLECAESGKPLYFIATLTLGLVGIFLSAPIFWPTEIG